MKILCCFKIVPDIEIIPENSWQNISSDILDTTYLKKIWNCFDESALEMILKLSDMSESFKIISNADSSKQFQIFFKYVVSNMSEEIFCQEFSGIISMSGTILKQHNIFIFYNLIFLKE